MDPTLLLGLLGGAGGMFGGPQSPEQLPISQWGGKFLKRSAKKAAAYGRGVPGSDPQEQAVLAQAMALLGGQQNAGMQDLYAAMGPNAGATGATGDLMKSAGALNQMQSSGLVQQYLLDFLSKRQNMRFNVAPNLASQAVSAGSLYRQPTPTGWEGLAPGLAQLAYAYTRRKGYGAGEDDGYATTGTSYGGWSPTSGGRL